MANSSSLWTLFLCFICTKESESKSGISSVLLGSYLWIIYFNIHNNSVIYILNYFSQKCPNNYKWLTRFAVLVASWVLNGKAMSYFRFPIQKIVTSFQKTVKKMHIRAYWIKLIFFYLIGIFLFREKSTDCNVVLMVVVWKCLSNGNAIYIGWKSPIVLSQNSEMHRKLFSVCVWNVETNPILMLRKDAQILKVWHKYIISFRTVSLTYSQLH